MYSNKTKPETTKPEIKTGNDAFKTIRTQTNQPFINKYQPQYFGHFEQLDANVSIQVLEKRRLSMQLFASIIKINIILKIFLY